MRHFYNKYIHMQELMNYFLYLYIVWPVEHEATC